MQHLLDRDVVILINDVARILRTRADQLARTRDMTRAQWVILIRLRMQPGMTQSEMAGYCEVEPITVARLVDRLESRGLVERRFDPADRRIRRLYLLPSAEAVLEEIDGYREMLNELLFTGISPSERTTLIDLLLRLKGNLGCRAPDLAKTVPAAE